VVAAEKTQREMIRKAIDELSAENLKQVGDYIAYLRYKEEHEMDWFERLYELFAPVREAAEAMSEEEINQAIDEAIAEVRRERET
jgi:uncharacterized protein YqeY